MDQDPIVVLDDAKSQHCRIFSAPFEILQANTRDEVGPILRRMQECIEGGFHLAGYFSYELGYLLEECLVSRLPLVRPVPLLWFGVFEHSPHILEGEAASLYFRHGGQAYAGPLRPEWDEAAYGQRFARVADWIRAGDIYQANLSLRASFSAVGDMRALYRDIRNKAGTAFGAYIDDGTRQILSFSPELFFELSADGRITSKPMKGTAPRADDAAEDASLREALRGSLKDRAENLMIVDLIRNDIGRVAEIGSVTVPDLFAVETYPTVHQMVSTVSATLKSDIVVERILRAIFPCGSITGAPKIRAMEVINDMESSPRGVYCGAIGYFAPDGSARFNVAIRTLTIAGGKGQLGIGGAVVYDSSDGAEYRECLLKARYFELGRRPITLIETLRYEAGRYTRLELHLRRLQGSAQVLGIPYDPARVRAALGAVGGGVGPLRVRLTLDEKGGAEATAAPLEPTSIWRYVISDKRNDSGDLLLRHKTNWREFYDGECERAMVDFECDEVVFLNERGELCEGSRSNLFLMDGSILLTPAVASGLLDGCLRQELLAIGRCREAILTPADLSAADRVYFGNSLRGLIEAKPAVRGALLPRPAHDGPVAIEAERLGRSTENSRVYGGHIRS